ncbi:MAG: TIGR03016 family PEP-CTERM system-associated outer membrane protein [Azonexus sp.]|nr:TIGR03016 family PEP-CTERM system-associated outer membrane protein [Azonexus sp.]
MKKSRLTATLLLALALPATAQQNASGALATPGIGMPGAVAGSSAADSDAKSDGRAWWISPRLGLSLTATNHADISSGANGKSDVIGEIAPGIRINAQTARLKGYLDYSAREQLYIENHGDRLRNALNAFGTLEAVDNWFYIDVGGNISQQAVSAFGPQSPDGASLNNNTTETSTWRVSPYIRGHLAREVDYLLRYNASVTRADNTGLSDVDVAQWVGQLRGSTPFHQLRWTLDANRQSVDYANGRKTDADLTRLLLTYLITPQFSISGSVGRERNDYASLSQESTDTYGYGFDWNPTPRTKISAFQEHRFFGNGHRFSFSHRFPMSSIRYSDVRDVTVLPNQSGTVGMGTMFEMFDALFANLITNPVDRANFVNSMLLGAGVDPNRQVVSGFMSSQASRQRQQQLTYVIYGARNSLTLQVNRSENSAIYASVVQLAGDFSRSSVIRQTGVSLNFSHRLSALANLNLLASHQKSEGRQTGFGLSNPKSTTTLYQIGLSTRLGPKTSGSLNVRHAKYDGDFNSYSENALIASLLYTY